MELGIEPDLVRWADSFMSDRKVKLVLEGREGGEHKVETGVPQGPPVAPILFTAYLSGVLDQVSGGPTTLFRRRRGVVGGWEVRGGGGGDLEQGGGGGAGLGRGERGHL